MSIDLFKLEVPVEKLHPNFKQLLKTRNEPVRKLLNLWTEGFIDRDGKLVKEFQTTFNSVFWELYLYNLFRSWGLTLDFTHQAPDFNINDFGGICVEATIANNADGLLPEWEYSGKEKEFTDLTDSEVYESFINDSVVRLGNSFISKLNKFKKSYSNLSHVNGKPFILAVAPFDRPDFYLQMQQAIIQLLYGKRIVQSNVENESIVVKEIPYVEKANGTEIEIGFFENSSCEEISAIIFSNLATFGKAEALAKDIQPFPINFFWVRYNQESFNTPHTGFSPGAEYHESIDDGIAIFINPMAKNPLPKEFIEKFQSINWDFLQNETKDNALISRQTIRITLFGDENKIEDKLVEKVVH